MTSYAQHCRSDELPASAWRDDERLVVLTRDRGLAQFVTENVSDRSSSGSIDKPQSRQVGSAPRASGRMSQPVDLSRLISGDRPKEKNAMEPRPRPFPAGMLESGDLAFSPRFYEWFPGLQVVQTSQVSLMVRLGGRHSIAVVYTKRPSEMRLLNRKILMSRPRMRLTLPTRACSRNRRSGSSTSSRGPSCTTARTASISGTLTRIAGRFRPIRKADTMALQGRRSDQLPRTGIALGRSSVATANDGLETGLFCCCYNKAEQ